jgi:hypothetical protein
MILFCGDPHGHLEITLWDIARMTITLAAYNPSWCFAPPVSPPCAGRVKRFKPGPVAGFFLAGLHTIVCSQRPGHPARGLLPTRKGKPSPLLRPPTHAGVPPRCRGSPAYQTSHRLTPGGRASPLAWCPTYKAQAPDVARPPAWPGSPQLTPVRFAQTNSRGRVAASRLTLLDTVGWMQGGKPPIPRCT